MEDIALFFQPAHIDLSSFPKESIGSLINTYNDTAGFPELDKPGIAIFFVPDYRGAGFSVSSEKDSLAELRSHFYHLYAAANWTHSIYDLGTILPGGSASDTRIAVKKVSEALIKKNIIPCVIGGSQDLTFAIYEAYKSLEMLINLTVVDAEFDIGNHENELLHNGWLSHILMDKSCYLFNFSNLGAQGHYIAPSSFKLFDELYFDVTRLGQLSDDLTAAEPVLRNSDLVSFDLEAIRFADFSAGIKGNVNGLDSAQACRIARYIGIADKISAVGFFNMKITDMRETDMSLLAQLIWYFNEGFASRKGDFPKGSKKSYKKFRVASDDFKDELVFYKSDKSSRWWMEVPYSISSASKYQRHQLVPCDIGDYEMAMKGELPDLWWKTYLKLSVE